MCLPSVGAGIYNTGIRSIIQESGLSQIPAPLEGGGVHGPISIKTSSSSSVWAFLHLSEMDLLEALECHVAGLSPYPPQTW